MSGATSRPRETAASLGPVLVFAGDFGALPALAADDGVETRAFADHTSLLAALAGLRYVRLYVVRLFLPSICCFDLFPDLRTASPDAKIWIAQAYDVGEIDPKWLNPNQGWMPVKYPPTIEAIRRELSLPRG